MLLSPLISGIFNVSLKKAMIRMFNSVRNPNHYLAIDNGKITMLVSFYRLL